MVWRRSKSPVGLRETMLTAPPTEFRPNSVPCGPLSTSIALDVHQRHAQALRAAEIDAVDVDADAGVAAGLVRDRHR
jgi:hypothetical protein